jgi:alanine or glycine:cation symporter, AGCS family
MFISVALSLFVFTSILYNYYLGESNLRFLIGENRKALIGYRALVLVLIFWGAIENLSTVFAFADITMTMLAFVNLIALFLLFKVGMRIMRDYDDQRAAGIKTPVFDSSKFPDLDLDLQAWPANPPAAAPKAEAAVEPQGVTAAQR